MSLDLNVTTSGRIRGSRLYVMVGCPGSGKSTWAATHLPNATYISRDAIRFAFLKPGEDYFAHEKETFKIFIDRIEAAIRNHDAEIVIDASHLNEASRAKLMNAIDRRIGKTEQYNYFYVCMDTPINEAIRRNNLREGRANVPENVIRNMYGQITKPRYSENDHIKGVWIVQE